MQASFCDGLFKEFISRSKRPGFKKMFTQDTAELFVFRIMQMFSGKPFIEKWKELFGTVTRAAR